MSKRTVNDPSLHGWIDDNGKWVWEGGKDTGHILDGDTDGQVTTWSDSAQEWTPDSTVVVSGGKVGIGTDSPSGALHINGTSSVSTQVLQTRGAESGGYYLHSTGEMIANFKGYKWQDMSGTTNLTIDASGNATFSGDITQIGPSGANHKFVLSGIYAWNIGINDLGQWYLQTDGGLIKAITVEANTGNATFSGTVNAQDHVATSDERLKDNITTAPRVIDQLHGREWEWKESGEKGSGVVAQELEEVLPHLVHTDDGGMKSVAYNGLVAYLIEEVKALRAEIEEMKS